MRVIYEGVRGEVGIIFKTPGHYEARDGAVKLDQRRAVRIGKARRTRQSDLLRSWWSEGPRPRGMRAIKACSGHCAGFSVSQAMAACVSSCI